MIPVLGQVSHILCLNAEEVLRLIRLCQQDSAEKTKLIHSDRLQISIWLGGEINWKEKEGKFGGNENALYCSYQVNVHVLYDSYPSIHFPQTATKIDVFYCM